MRCGNAIECVAASTTKLVQLIKNTDERMHHQQQHLACTSWSWYLHAHALCVHSMCLYTVHITYISANNGRSTHEVSMWTAHCATNSLELSYCITQSMRIVNKPTQGNDVAQYCSPQVPFWP